MLLSDEMITQQLGHGITIDPYNPERLQPTSVDLTLDSWIRVPNSITTIDVAQVPPEHTRLVQIDPDDGFELLPGRFILASTHERIKLSSYYAARVEGKSSIGRLGLAIHVTAGFIDPGFNGQVTLELFNLAPWSIRLRVGMPIGQICFMECYAPIQDYSKIGHYQGQEGPTESRFRL